MTIVDINELINSGKYIYNKMTTTSYSIDRSWENCHNSFLKIKRKYDNPANNMTSDELDYLCLSLGWYLASWGMLRNSFLKEYSHEIHKDTIKVIYDHQWDSLWDIDYATLNESNAQLIQDLAMKIEETYKNNHDFPQANYKLTDTLKTKILLGTIACVPAYDRFFVCSLKHTLEQSRFCTESLIELSNVYQTYATEFDSMRIYCGSGYPSAKLLDMCFFNYGVKLSEIEEKFKKVVESKLPNFNSRTKEGRNITNLICLYVMHGNSVKNIPSLSTIYNKNSTTYDSIRQEVLLKL